MKGFRFAKTFIFLLNLKIMKKLKLMALKLGAKELLTREQLKNVLGGDGSSLGDGDGPCRVSLGCNLYNRADGITYPGNCYYQIGGNCFCLAHDKFGQTIISDPSVYSTSCHF